MIWLVILFVTKKLSKRANQSYAFRGLKTGKGTEMAPTEIDLDERLSELSSDMIQRNNNSSNNSKLWIEIYNMKKQSITRDI